MPTGKLKWYYSRLSTMNLREMMFRIGQVQQRSLEKVFSAPPAFDQVTVNQINFNFSFREIMLPGKFRVFGRHLPIDNEIDFHLDIFSGKRFPLSFSKTIDIRTDKYGSAKAVWEVNRLQFLLPLLTDYRITGDRAKLDQFISIMESWKEQNPYLRGINWYSNLEVNIRLINWYWCWILLEKDENWQKEARYKAFREEVWLPLIYSHCVYSEKNPSQYSSANNRLIAEYAGLFVASTLWKFRESASWLKISRRGLEREIIRQHSANGVNREEAASCIQFITDFFLLAYLAAEHAGIAFSSRYTQALKTICGYINNLLDMNGNIPKYGDEDDGRVILPDGNFESNNFLSILNTAAVLFNKPELKRHGAQWDMKSHLLTTRFNGQKVWEQFRHHSSPARSAFYEQEGHFILRKHTDNETEVYCHFDAAPLGYLSIAAHGHADALSMIVHIDGYPFLVDPGTYSYHTHTEWRQYFVSTLAHNTVTINQADQARWSGPTLWRDHYKSSLLHATISPEIDSVCATHNGYRKEGINHKRMVELNKKKDYIKITDQIDARKAGYMVNIPFHLHPEVFVLQTADNTYILGRKETPSTLELTFDPLIDSMPIQASDDEKLGWYSPSFMKKEKSAVIMGEHQSDAKSLTLITYIKIINRA